MSEHQDYHTDLFYRPPHTQIYLGLYLTLKVVKLMLFAASRILESVSLYRSLIPLPGLIEAGETLYSRKFVSLFNLRKFLTLIYMLELDMAGQGNY